jgi:hypothetical protein
VGFHFFELISWRVVSLPIHAFPQGLFVVVSLWSISAHSTKNPRPKQKAKKQS